MMARGRRDLFLQLLSRTSMHEPELASEVFGAIESAAPAWTPGRWDVAEPARRPWEPDRIDEVWRSLDFTCVSAERGAAEILVHKRWKRGTTHGELWIGARSGSVTPEAAMRHLGVSAFWRPGMSRPIMPRGGRPRPPGRAPSFDDLRLEAPMAAGR